MGFLERGDRLLIRIDLNSLYPSSLIQPKTRPLPSWSNDIDATEVHDQHYKQSVTTIANSPAKWVGIQALGGPPVDEDNVMMTLQKVLQCRFRCESEAASAAESLSGLPEALALGVLFAEH